jgi:3-methyladenine DNA glycosylase Mpg
MVDRARLERGLVARSTAMDLDPHETLGPNFFKRDARKVARDLIGSYLVRRKAGTVLTNKITETEAYIGPHDLACHASRGHTERPTQCSAHRERFTCISYMACTGCSM